MGLFQNLSKQIFLSSAVVPELNYSLNTALTKVGLGPNLLHSNSFLSKKIFKLFSFEFISF